MIARDVNLELLAQQLWTAGRPLHINVLARAAVRAWLEDQAEVRLYVPGARYVPGETIHFKDELVTVKAVQTASNLKQGQFKILTLALPDGTEKHMAAEVTGAPAEERQPVSDEQLDRIIRQGGSTVRLAVQGALTSDDRFARFQDTQGDGWCLREMLPQVSQTDLQRALAVLPDELMDGEVISYTTEELVRAVWGLEDDGGDVYALHTFALNRSLNEHGAVVNLGHRWASAQAWNDFTDRQTLGVPRMPTDVTLPDGVKKLSAEEIEEAQHPQATSEGIQPEPEEPAEGEGLEIWREDRPIHAKFTLHAQHYYEGWLPLSGRVRRLFPPLTSGRQEVIFYDHFGDEPESFRAWVDRKERRVWMSEGMYETFRRRRVYPGARLRLSARNEWEYDVGLREPTRADPIRVWRMWLDENGQILYEDHEEPRRYDVDDDVYVADVRFEDLEALFRQAEEAGNSIFGLMYQQCVQWWEAGGREELIVTADQLFEAIHFDEKGRMTSKATVAWELWRRLAYEPKGDGHYQFRPQFGGSTGSARRVTKTDLTHSAAPDDAELFWQNVGRLRGRKLHTLGEGAAFDVLDVDEKAVRIRVASSGHTYSIYHRELESIWDILTRHGELRQIAIHSELGLPNPTYAAAILAALPNVSYEVRPIRLMYASTFEMDLSLPSPSDSLGVAGFFIFQQRPGSEYADRVGEIYNWRQGIPGSKQVAEGAHFIYYRPGERVFFGTGWVASIKEYVGKDNQIFYDGRIAGYEPWDPPLPLTRELALRLSFVQPERLGIGQAGIRKISQEDFETLLEAYRQISEVEAELQQIQAIVQVSLVGQTIHTLTGRPNRIAEVDDEELTVITEKGEGKVLWEWVQSVYKALRRLGRIERKDVQKGPWRTVGGFRSAFIFGLLARFAHIEAHTKPRIGLAYHKPEGDVRLLDSVPIVERRRDGQLIAANLIPQGPLFEAQPEADSAPSELPAIEPHSESSVNMPPSSPATRSQHQEPSASAPRPRSRRDEGRTKTLFSNHYLETRLPDHPEWAKDPRAAFEAVHTLWKKAQLYGQNWNEAQTEEEFVKLVLGALGWAFIVQPKSGSKGRITRPDYALFESAQAKDKAYPHLGDDDPFYTRALAIAEAKYWGRQLSQKDASDRNTWKIGGNPSHQMVSYLVGTRVPWGILTNGRTWRLYSREVSSTASEFYEVNLGLIFDLLSDDAEPSAEKLDQFRRWWLFFQCDAFTPDAQGKSFVQRVHEGSATYAREISDKLKELVFEQVVPEIAGGFVAYRYHQRGIRHKTDKSLREIYQATLGLLYKLLFLLYAEARRLLPVTNPGYREQSLTTMARWAADQLDKALPLSDATHATPKYDALLALFSRLDQGDPSLGIPRYNGGLFNPVSPENRFLKEHKLSDRAVARAVDTLVRDAGQPVDYAYISVRNLGAIYEGLLENRLRVVDAAAGRVELVDDKGERKASGSYYTPDYIVEYIVQHTLEPVLDERQIRFEAAMDRCADLRRQLRRTDDATTVRLLRQQLDEAERGARETFLGIKVCDPAMGSGHFLVNAVDHLTDGIIQRMQIYHDDHTDVPWDWNPVQRLIERVRGEILAEMDRQGIAVGLDRLDDTALLTRLVMKRCIYGVDLNLLAVELAKLSLWLHSFTVGAPLSFLDHHLRWGNSLIGTDVRTVEAAIQKTETGQFALFAGPFAGLLDLTALMIEVAGQADATLADVQHSAEVFEQFQKQLTPYKQVLDLWVSQHFGNTAAHEFLTLYGDDVLPALCGERQVTDQYKDAIERARALWREKRFFHWDLEFPEIFVDLRKRDWAENPGFDAVIGNPPYGLTESFAWFTNLYNDAFVYFWQRGIDTSTSGGLLSFITPLAWLTGINYQQLREALLDETNILSIVGLPYDVFGDAYIDTCVAVTKAGEPTVGLVQVKQMGKRDDATQVNKLRMDTLEVQFWRDDPYKKFVLIPAVARLQRFFSSPGFVRFGELMRVERGVQPYSRRKHTDEQIKADFLRVFTAPPPGLQDVYFPELLGEELSRYRIEPKKQSWLTFSDELASKRDVEFFTQPRVVLRRLLSRRRELMAAMTDERLITTDNILNILVTADDIHEGYVTALLNSRLLAWLYTNTSTISVKDDFPQVTYEELRSLPIPLVTFTTPVNGRQRHAGKGRQLYEQFCAKEDYVCIRDFVAHHLDTGRNDVVHDLLAHLAEQMIAMNKNKQAEVKGFLTWLEREIGASIDGLTRKTYLRNYLGDYQKDEPHLVLEDVLNILRRNHRRLQVDPSARVFQEHLAREYEGSLAKLLPLKAHLTATDRLIDQVVYQLYGLTEEEIATVEGKQI
jgi:hypothetical protein